MTHIGSCACMLAGRLRPIPYINSVGAMRNSNTHVEELQVVLFVSHKSDVVVDLDCASNQF